MQSARRLTRSTAARAAFAAALLLAAPLRAQEADAPAPAPEALSLEEALRLARENNPAFLQQENDLDVARSSVRAAYGGLLPTASATTGFGYTAPGEVRVQSRLLGEEPAAYYSQYSLSMQYQIDGRTLLEPGVQRAQQRAVRGRVAGAAANLDAQVTQQYLAVLRAREQESQAEREVARTGEHVRLAEARLEVGAGTPLDVRRAEVQRGRAEVSLVQARNNAATQTLMLGQLLGASVDPAVRLSSQFAIFDPTWTAAELVDLALGGNPNLIAARSTQEAARTGVAAARSTFLPTLSFQIGWRGYVNQYADIDPLVDRALGGIDYAGCLRENRVLALIGETGGPCVDPSNPLVREGVRGELEAANRGFPFDYINQPWQAGVSISIPIFTGLSRQLQVDQAQAAAADARHEVRARELGLRQEVATALLNLETMHQTALLQEQVRQSAEEELRLAQERFRFGAASSVEVTDAQTNLAQAERDQIDAVYNFHQSLAALEALVGRPLR